MSGEADQNKKPSFNKRVISGCILAPVIVTLVVWGRWSFMALIAFAACVSLYEWFRLAKADSRQYQTMAIGCVYLLVCFSSYVFLRFGFEQGGWLALAVMLSVWASDTGAYFIGKAIGGPKLAPRISPNKTWAGFGGAIFCSGLLLMMMAGLGRFIPETWLITDIGLRPGHVWSVFLVGCLLGVVGQAGDLFVSYFKRRGGLKDTGHLIPGHGGLLDRIDSLLLVAPVFALIVVLWVG